MIKHPLSIKIEKTWKLENKVSNYHSRRDTACKGSRRTLVGHY